MQKSRYMYRLMVCLLLTTVITACGGRKGDIHVITALQAFEAENYQEAAFELEQAAEAGVAQYKPEEVYTLLGRVYEADRQYNKAISAHKKALEFNRDYYKAWVNLGVAYRLSGNLDKAEESYNEALRIEPDYAELHASLGALYIFKNNPKKALDSLTRAIELDSQLAVAHANIALAYAMVGQFELADIELDEAIQLGYKNTTIIKARIQTLKERKE